MKAWLSYTISRLFASLYSDGPAPISRELCTGSHSKLHKEALHERHGIKVGRETLRTWMLEAGLWASRKQRKNSPPAAA